MERGPVHVSHVDCRHEARKPSGEPAARELGSRKRDTNHRAEVEIDAVAIEHVEVCTNGERKVVDVTGSGANDRSVLASIWFRVGGSPVAGMKVTLPAMVVELWEIRKKP